MKRCRRVLSHHGSDCDLTSHSIRSNRCIILTRIDHKDGTSEAWLSGDCQEGRRFQYKRHRFAGHLPVFYGGGFWEKVEIPPLAETPAVTVSGTEPLPDPTTNTAARRGPGIPQPWSGKGGTDA
ncbi:MAG TPA: hypothetical protein VFO16_14090 [Pseudonocardiaceae bacterium]|nr:hypothetical protein [Pseudonocardiaceae bacterium]